MRLSVLDQSMIVSGRSPDQSIRETVALAQHCDELGYERFWVSEHHSSGSIAGTAPEVLLAAIAMVTRRIRLGSAGVMLPHYAALKVAEQFRVLEALAPGRIDLGVGRAPGSDQRTAFALNPGAATAADRFPEQLRDVIAWSGGGALPEAHPFRAVVAQPVGPFAPEVWVLGSSQYGAQVAAYFGLPYAYAYFFASGEGAAEALDLYRAHYRPSERHPEPHASIAVFALAADTQAEAARLLWSRLLWRLYFQRGEFVPLPSVADAEAYPYTPAELARAEAERDRAIHGTGETVVRGLAELAARLRVQEVAVVTPAHDPAARRRSFSLIAGAADLKLMVSRGRRPLVGVQGAKPLGLLPAPPPPAAA